MTRIFEFLGIRQEFQGLWQFLKKSMEFWKNVLNLETLNQKFQNFNQFPQFTESLILSHPELYKFS
jgi:hypothetical protein